MQMVFKAVQLDVTSKRVNVDRKGKRPKAESWCTPTVRDQDGEDKTPKETEQAIGGVEENPESVASGSRVEKVLRLCEGDKS